MKLKIVILENDADSACAVKNSVKTIAVKEDFDYELLYVSSFDTAVKNINTLASADIAVISAGFQNSLLAGERLAVNNPLLIIAYYGDGVIFDNTFLRTRPLYLSSGKRIISEDELTYCVRRWKEQTRFFTWNLKSADIAVPYSSILYFSSQGKFVNLKTTEGEYQFRAILDKVQELTDAGLFLRIHKSFLVNRRYIRGLNRSDKQLQLINNETLPVSDAFYRRLITSRLLNFTFSEGKNDI